jgi:hypothetical protein
MQSISQTPFGSFNVPDRDEQLAKALAKQKEVMLVKILAEQDKHKDARSMKSSERQHLTAMRRVRQEALDLIRLSSAKRETRRKKIEEQAFQLKVKEAQLTSAWKKGLRKRTKEVMSRTFTESRASQRSALRTAERQRRFEETKMVKQESEQVFITDCLKQYEEKMMRHDSRHKGAMQSISDQFTAKVSKVKEISQTIETLREVDGVQKVKRLIEKHEESSRRRAVIDTKRLARISEHQRAQSEKRRQIQARVQKVASEIRSKSQVMEHKMQASTVVLKKKFETWNKELIIRHELSKLKNEDTLETAERHNRIAGQQRMQIIDRHLKDRQRLEELKQARSQMSNQSKEVQFIATQERVRLKSALSQVAKSPESAKTKEILRQLQV